MGQEDRTFAFLIKNLVIICPGRGKTTPATEKQSIGLTLWVIFWRLSRDLPIWINPALFSTILKQKKLTVPIRLKQSSLPYSRKANSGNLISQNVTPARLTTILMPASGPLSAVFTWRLWSKQNNSKKQKLS